MLTKRQNKKIKGYTLSVTEYDFSVTFFKDLNDAYV